MRWQFTCVGSSLGSLAADAHVGGGRVLSLRRGALAARREDEESSLGMPCERSACVRWVMRRTRFVAVRKKEDEVVCAQRGHDGVYFLNVTNHACDVSGRLP